MFRFRPSSRIATPVLAFVLAFAVPAHAEDPEAPRYPQADLDALRLQLEDLRATYLAIAEDTSPEMLTTMTERFRPFDELSDEDLADLKDTGVDLQPLVDSSVELRDVSEEFLAGADFGAAEKSAGLPGAPYSSVCGSSRNSVPAMFVAGRTLQVAEGVFSIADRGCNQVGVAAGFGGNTSLACIAADTVLAAARYVFDTFAFCDRDIDSAEIAGSYRRLGHVHDDVAALDGKLSGIGDDVIDNSDDNRALIIANANANRDAVITNDNVNRDVLFGQAEANAAAILTATRTLAEREKSREVENFLRMRECTAWMYTPASMGGEVDFVLDVVDRVVTDAHTLGSVEADRLTRAEAALAAARALAGNSPLDALGLCRALFVAYAESTPSKVDRNFTIVP